MECLALLVPGLLIQQLAGDAGDLGDLGLILHVGLLVPQDHKALAKCKGKHPLTST